LRDVSPVDIWASTLAASLQRVWLTPVCVLSTAQCRLNCDAGYKFTIVDSFVPSDWGWRHHGNVGKFLPNYTTLDSIIHRQRDENFKINTRRVIKLRFFVVLLVGYGLRWDEVPRYRSLLYHPLMVDEYGAFVAMSIATVKIDGINLTARTETW